MHNAPDKLMKRSYVRMLTSEQFSENVLLKIINNNNEKYAALKLLSMNPG